MRATRPALLYQFWGHCLRGRPLEERKELADGNVWRKHLTPEKAKVAETLDEFWGQYRYNLMDAQFQRFNAQVPVFAQWDDHEVTNNWWPGQILDDDRYTVREVDVLAQRGRQASLDYMPLRETSPERRIYRTVRYGPALDIFFSTAHLSRSQHPNLQPSPSSETILGREQLSWLKQKLKRSTATWKVIACDMPLGVVVSSDRRYEAIANQNGGPPLSREFEIADLLRHVNQRGTTNLVWLTADVRYTAAHRYDPGSAAVGEFPPFWEFVSGPIHAGSGTLKELDATSGPQIMFAKGAGKDGLGPPDGLQFFGEMRSQEKPRS